jgi:hypothetical protein
MKTTIQAPLIFVLLSSLLFAAGYLEPVKANPFGMETDYTALPLISISAPSNSTFSPDNVSLSIVVSKPNNWLIHGGMNARQMLKSISYQLDEKIYGPFVANSYLESPFNYSMKLTDLKEGEHSLKVYAEATGWFIEWHDLWEREASITASSDTLYFTVEKNVPAVIVAPIENSSTPDVPLNFNVNCTASRIVYSLDGQENQSIAGNTSLTGLSNGLHNVTVYAWNLDGNVGASETTYFYVQVPEPFPTVVVAAVSAGSVAVFCVGALFYLRKRKC